MYGHKLYTVKLTYIINAHAQSFFITHSLCERSQLVKNRLLAQQVSDCGTSRTGASCFNMLRVLNCLKKGHILSNLKFSTAQTIVNF